MRKIKVVLMMLLFAFSCNVYAQKIEKERHNPASKTTELPPDWEVTVAYEYNSMTYDYSDESIHILKLWWTSCNETPSETLNATVSFAYIGKKSIPSDISTSAKVYDLVSCYLSGSLKPETGSLFNLSVSHAGVLSGEKCKPQKVPYMLSMSASGAYDKTTNSNVGINGVIEGGLITVSGNYENKTNIKVFADKNRLVFDPKTLDPNPSFYTLSRGNDGETSVEYAFSSEMSIQQKHEIASSNVRGRSRISSVSFQAFQ